MAESPGPSQSGRTGPAARWWSGAEGGAIQVGTDPAFRTVRGAAEGRIFPASGVGNVIYAVAEVHGGQEARPARLFLSGAGRVTAWINPPSAGPITGDTPAP